MCGIIGIVTKDSKQYKNEIDRGISALKHRGPDGDGSFFFKNCALGHTRLSIVDINLGHQPMFSTDQQKAITFNGEIYGYKEIKEQLKDYTFNTNSDTETIIALYEKYGINTADKLPGMFSFAIWDENDQSLYCARDRFGEKPFYFATGENGEFIFASEIKAILATKLVKPILDIESVKDYLTHLYVNPNKTIYKNIYTLPPAHYLIYKNDKIEIKRYFSLPETSDKIGLNDAVQKFKSLLEESVKKQLIADVPVSAFLSGGLDSSTIVALASKYSPNIQTLSFGFGNSINELPVAKQVAEKYKTRHVELQINNYDVVEIFMKMQEIFDEPFADSSNIPTYLISREARKYGKVVLTGDGGDEMLAGYSGWYKPLYFSKHKTYKVKNIVKDILKIISKNSLSAKKDLYYRLQGIKNNLSGKNLFEAHIEKTSYFSDKEIERLFGKAEKKEKINKNDSIDDIIKYDILNYLPGDILVKTDRSSMSVGLELRAPFLDKDLASFCISLPYRLKIDNKKDKLLLREAFEELWPKEVKKKDKQGFGSPINEWLKSTRFKDLIKKYLEERNNKIFQILDYRQTQKLINKNNYKTWALLTLSVWLEKHDFIIEK